VSHDIQEYFTDSRAFYSKALYEFEAVGNHRLVAIVENNLGYLLLAMEEYSEAESYLLRARLSFDWLNDKIRSAQADDSLARLYLAQQRHAEAELMIDRAVRTMEIGDEDALLAEALVTKGLVYCRSGRFIEGKQALQDGHRIASRCGDIEGAGRALLVLMEEMREFLETEECRTVCERLIELLSSSEQPSILRRLRNVLRTRNP